MTYSFTLHVTGINTRSENYEGALYDAGCGDALVAVIDDTLYLDFDRDASSYVDAVKSATRDVEKAGGKVIEATRLSF
jgi:hypothetical protein